MSVYGILNEGYIFHSKDGKEIKSKIAEILKQYNKSTGSFKEKFKKNMKDSLPPRSDIEKVKKQISSLFKEFYWTDIIIKAREYDTGYSTVYEEYYAMDLCGLTKNNTAMHQYISFSGAGIHSNGFKDDELKGDNIKIYSDILKILNNSSFKKFAVVNQAGTGKKYFKISNGEARSHKDEMQKLYELLSQKLDNCLVKKKLLSITVKKL